MITNLITPDYCEYTYIAEILSYLPATGDTHVIAMSMYQQIPEVGPHVLVLNTSSERYEVPPYVQQVRAVWSCYVREESDRLFALPLGPVWDIPVVPMVEPRARQYDVFFAGQYTKLHRRELGRLEKMLAAADISADIVFTDAFRSGLPKQEYAERLMQGRVALCPKGFAVETFRHFEAARSGCALMSAPLPANSLYKGAPVWEVEPYGREHLVLAIQEALRDIEQEHAAVVRWWETMWSPRALAARIQEYL